MLTDARLEMEAGFFCRHSQCGMQVSLTVVYPAIWCLTRTWSWLLDDSLNSALPKEEEMEMLLITGQKVEGNDPIPQRLFHATLIHSWGRIVMTSTSFM